MHVHVHKRVYLDGLAQDVSRHEARVLVNLGSDDKRENPR